MVPFKVSITLVDINYMKNMYKAFNNLNLCYFQHFLIHH